MNKNDLLTNIPSVYVKERENVLNAMSDLLEELERAGFERTITLTLSRDAPAEEIRTKLHKQSLGSFDGVVVIALLGVTSEEAALEMCCLAREIAARIELRIVFVLATKEDARLSCAARVAGLNTISDTIK